MKKTLYKCIFDIYDCFKNHKEKSCITFSSCRLFIEIEIENLMNLSYKKVCDLTNVCQNLNFKCYKINVTIITLEVRDLINFTDPYR